MKSLEAIIKCDHCGKNRSDLDITTVSRMADMKNPNLPRLEFRYCMDDLVCKAASIIWSDKINDQITS